MTKKSTLSILLSIFLVQSTFAGKKHKAHNLSGPTYAQMHASKSKIHPKHKKKSVLPSQTKQLKDETQKTEEEKAVKLVKKFINGSLENAYTFKINPASPEQKEDLQIKDLFEEDVQYLLMDHDGDSHMTFDHNNVIISSPAKQERLNKQLADLIAQLKQEAKTASEALKEQNAEISQEDQNLVTVLESIAENANEHTIALVEQMDAEIMKNAQAPEENNPHKTLLERLLDFKKKHPAAYYLTLTVLGTVSYIAIDAKMHFASNGGFDSIWEFLTTCLPHIPKTGSAFLEAAIDSSKAFLEPHIVPYICFMQDVFAIPTIMRHMHSGYYRIKKFITQPFRSPQKSGGGGN